MAESEKISEADRIEQANLERVVSDAERRLLALPPGTRPFFTGFLQNAKARIGVLEKKIHQAEQEQRNQAQNEVAIVSLAQKESALSEREKETYSGFLKEGFFTKKDLSRLEEFYAHSWDRLSEGGKNQMSHRIWEGIRREEYKFTELPWIVQEKEAERAYSVLKQRETSVGLAGRIPASDRDDFIHAYESGKREETYGILDRDSFRQTMFRVQDSKEIQHSGVEKTREAESDNVRERLSRVSAARVDVKAEPTSGAKADLDISNLNLDGVKMAQAPTEVSAADIPTTGANRPLLSSR